MTDLTLQTLIEFRTEMREFRDETRNTAARHEHRLSLLTEYARDQAERLGRLAEQMRAQSVRLAQLVTHMAALPATMNCNSASTIDDSTSSP
jgi:hypothetical protein